MFLVVAYDLPDDRRRTRLHQRLKNFGTPVQYSVFECLLAPQHVQRLQAVVRETIDASTDTVRYYQLCESCRTKIIAINSRVTTVTPTVII